MSKAHMHPDTFSEIRRDLGKSQDAMGVQLGVNARTIRRWEEGIQPVPVSVGKMMRALAVVEANKGEEGDRDRRP